MSKAIKSLKYYNLEQSVARATKLFRFGKQINLTIVAGQNCNFTRFYNTRKNIEKRLRRKQNRERNREFKQRRLRKPSITEEGKNQN